jgi:hypothetical protein
LGQGWAERVKSGPLFYWGPREATELTMKSRLAWWRVSLFVTFLPMALLAQDTASITGTVTDPSGAAIASAQVTLSNAEHGINRTTKTNGSGDYLVSVLPPGTYNLIIEGPGFKKYEAKGIILRVAQNARANATLQVGAESTEITVEGTSVAQVETESNELAGTITGKEISQLQLNGRVFSQLVTLTPGVSDQTGSSEGTAGDWSTTTGNSTAATIWTTAAIRR